MSLRVRIIRLILIAFMTPVLFLLGCQSRLIYFPRPYQDDHRQELQRTGGIPLVSQTKAGRQTSFYVPPRSGGGVLAGIWLCFNGNGALALDWLPLVETWDPRFAYLLIDYPGYGDSEGKPNPATIREASSAAVTALAAHLQTTVAELQPRLGVLGHSIGCAAGLMAAADLQVQRVVLVAPFTTMTEMGRRVLGWPLCCLNLHRFDNRKHLAQVVKHGASVVVFHGTADEIIPVEMSRELAAAQAGRVILHEKAGAHHNDIVGEIADELGQTLLVLAALP